MISIIDYRAGNLKSVERALKHIGAECLVTADKDTVRNSERIIFPGVGAAGRAMANLKELGLDEVISDAFRSGKPILGICLGAQIVLDKSEENDSTCLGLIEGSTKRFPEDLSSGPERLKIPHMGWNSLTLKKAAHPVLAGVKPEDEFYFVHSYYPSPRNAECVLAETVYGIRFSSVVGTRNLIAMQFHLEKSGTAGLRILRNFCNWDGNA
jgi:imidazole glycerol-phosphate synthase subunit HisH